MLNLFKWSSEARGSFPNVSEETRRNVTPGASLSPEQLNISDETSATRSKEQDLVTFLWNVLTYLIYNW